MVTGLSWKQNSAGTRVYYLYDGSAPVCELNSSGQVQGESMFGANGLIAYNDGSHGSQFYAFDERGNVAQRVDASGNVASSDLYDAYGQLLSGNPSGDPYGFSAQAGYRTDAETGLCLLTYRYYDPAAGRFVTRDPAGYGGGINLYSYTQNNPGNRMDPSGHGVMDTIASGVGYAGTVTGLTINMLTGVLGDGNAGYFSKTFNSAAADTLEELSSANPAAAPGTATEAIASDSAHSVLAQLVPNSGLLETSSAEVLSTGGTIEGVGGVSVLGGGGVPLAPITAFAIPAAVIGAGIYAAADLAHYAATGKSNGFFTSLGQSLADKYFPGSDGLPASTSPKLGKCR